jgi:hypothetical protein
MFGQFGQHAQQQQAPVLLPPGPGMMGGGQGGGGGGGAPQGGGGFANFAAAFGQGGFGAWRGQPQQQQPPPHGYYPQQGGGGGLPPGSGYAQPGMPSQGGYSSSGNRMQGIAGPAVARSLGTIHGGSNSPKMHLFQKTLRDMITGMRQHKNPSDQQRFLHKCMAEMRDEARAPAGQQRLLPRRGAARGVAHAARPAGRPVPFCLALSP